ncbi:asparaginase domain-containing protein [Bacteroidota bacterium]
MKDKKIKIFTLGGSIDKNYSMEKSDFVVDAPQISKVLEEANVTFPFEVEEIIRKDSLKITDDERTLLRKKIENETAKRIIITHGTDTMHLTGQALQSIKDKTIVITGAMQPAAFKNTDAHFNIGTAFIAVQTLDPGVYIVMNGQVFDPNDMKKNMDTKTFEKK